MKKLDKIDVGMKGIVVLEISVNDDGTKWSKIKYCRKGSPRYGWVASRYLSPAYASYNAAKRYKVVNISYNDTLNMRSGPGKEYIKLGEISANANNITLLQCRRSTKGGRWCKIRYDIQEGWVSALYLLEQ